MNITRVAKRIDIQIDLSNRFKLTQSTFQLFQTLLFARQLIADLLDISFDQFQRWTNMRG